MDCGWYLELYEIDRIGNNAKTNQFTASTFVPQETSTSRTPVIQFGPSLARPENSKLNFSVDNLLRTASQETSTSTSKLHVTIDSQITPKEPEVALSASSTGGNLCIDEDYDN